MKQVTVTNTLAELIEDCQNYGEQYMVRKGWIADAFAAATDLAQGGDTPNIQNLLGELARTNELLNEMTKKTD